MEKRGERLANGRSPVSADKSDDDTHIFHKKRYFSFDAETKIQI